MIVESKIGFLPHYMCTGLSQVPTLRSVNDVTEGITQESPMGVSWVIPRKVSKMV